MRKHKLLNGAATAGNADKDFTFEGVLPWQVLYGQVVLTTDATAANRRVLFQVLDQDDNVVIDIHSGAVVTASASDQHHECMQGVFRETSFVGGALQVPIPRECLVPKGGKLRISIENGVAGDSFTSSFMAIEYI